MVRALLRRLPPMLRPTQAFLNWRKGKCFATYSFGIRFEFMGGVRVGGRIVGQSRGVGWIYDVK